MDEALLEVRDHAGEGYRALVDSGGWRVAVLRFQDGLLPEQQASMERHLETDEVFVLTKGRGVLILGGNGQLADGFAMQVMEIGKVYNIRRSTWHTVALSRDASVLIVENQDTGTHNSEYVELTGTQREIVRELSRGIDADP
ncbi:MAG: hypothetical protein ACM3MF_01925 [Anaerolineae bacterium]